MFVGIGFLGRGLAGYRRHPLVHARAVRLTMRRLEALTPLSMAEIQADKDQLRAEFAMSTRRLEMSVEQMKAKTTSQLAEIGKKSEAVGRLSSSSARRPPRCSRSRPRKSNSTTIFRICATSSPVRGARTRRSSGCWPRRRPSSPGQGNFHESSVTADSQRVELVAMRAQVEVLKSQIESYEKEVKELRDRLTYKTSESAMYSQQLTEERLKASRPAIASASSTARSWRSRPRPRCSIAASRS